MPEEWSAVSDLSWQPFETFHRASSSLYKCSGVEEAARVLHTTELPCLGQRKDPHKLLIEAFRKQITQRWTNIDIETSCNSRNEAPRGDNSHNPFYTNFITVGDVAMAYNTVSGENAPSLVL